MALTGNFFLQSAGKRVDFVPEHAGGYSLGLEQLVNTKTMLVLKGNYEYLLYLLSLCEITNDVTNQLSQCPNELFKVLTEIFGEVSLASTRPELPS